MWFSYGGARVLSHEHGSYIVNYQGWFRVSHHAQCDIQMLVQVNEDSGLK